MLVPDKKNDSLFTLQTNEETVTHPQKSTGDWGLKQLSNPGLTIPGTTIFTSGKLSTHGPSVL